MPTRLAVPLLAVDESRMHEIDTSNVENLFSMWTVFSRCADSLDQGRRLENLSWRLWNRETFCCEPRAHFANPPARLDRTPRQSLQEVPRLSSSVDSASSCDEYHSASGDHPAPPSPVTIRGLSSSSTSIQSMSVGRSKPKPISSQAWERMVISIKETKITQKEDLPALSASVTAAVRPVVYEEEEEEQQQQQHSDGSVPTPTPEVQAAYKQSLPRASHSSTSTVPLSSPDSSLAQSQICGSDTSAELMSAPEIVRGFTASSVCYRTSTPSSSSAGPSEPAPIKSALRNRADIAAGKKPQFMLGGGSSDEESSSLEDQMYQRRTIPQTSQPAPKQASFSDRVELRQYAAPSRVEASDDEGAIASDDEDDDVDESAIEDDDEDDDDDWDEVSDDGEPEQPAAPVFTRIDSKANLASRRSLITSALHQSDRASQLATQAAMPVQLPMRRSRQTSPSGPSLAASVEEDEPMQGIKIARSKPIITTTTNIHQAALSPRTTRRNMLATELTESLRKHLLWERKQKATTVNAALKRRHTAQDMAHLKKQPGPGASGGNSKTSSWNDYFEHGLSEYHSRGW